MGYEAIIETKAREKQLELIGALRVLITRDDSAIAWAKRKDALCFVELVVDRIPTPVLEECVKSIRQRSMKRKEVLLRALLEFYQDMPMQISTEELKDMDSYRRLKEVRRWSNKELTVTRELLEGIRSLKEYATLGKRKFFQHVSCVPGTAYDPFVNEEARDSYFAHEQAVILKFCVKRVRKMETVSSQQLQLGVILEERVIEPSVLQLEGQVSFECGSWDGPLKTSLVTTRELMRPSWCLIPNATLIWVLNAETELECNDVESLHDLAKIHHLLALKITR